MKRTAYFALMIVAAPVLAQGQNPTDWLEVGHRHAAESRHRDAIAAYERALREQPALRPELVGRLGRQYLWADDPAQAAALLEEYLRGHNECDVRNDYGLALLRDDQLKRAEDVLANVIAECGDERSTARLRLALVQRWQDRASRAAAIYRAVIAEGDSAAAAQARVGLAYTELMLDNNRAALASFRALDGLGRDAREGQALAWYRLGEPHRASLLIDGMRADGPLSRDMRELAATLDQHHSVTVEPSAVALSDADGTRMSSVVLSASKGLGVRSRGAVTVGQRWLTGFGDSYHTTMLGARAEHRWNPDVAVRANLDVSRIDKDSWTPLTGELSAVITPSDVWRFDLSAARIMVTDNVAATRNEITGDFVSAGVDRRVGSGTTLIGAVDHTTWSSGNQRLRLRASVRHQFQGRPRITVEWPTLWQRYNEPFDFVFFSPASYWETGPAVNLYQRTSRSWAFSAYGRAGLQRESGLSTSLFGTVRGVVMRDVTLGWSLRAAAGWSNSNLASSSAFRRTMFTIDLVRPLD